MRLGEYIRLGRISLKNRKKSTRNTVIGISFGLILLIPVLFFTLSFSIDLTNAINGARSVSCFAVATVNESDPQDGYEQDPNENRAGYGGVLLGHAEREALFDMVGGAVEEIVSQEYLDVNAKNDGYTLNGEPFITWWREGDRGYIKGTEIKILRGNYADCVPAGIHSDLARLNSSFLAAGQGFSQNSKGEILISEALVRANGMTPEEAIGASLSLHVEANTYYSGGTRYDMDNDNDPDNAFVEPTDFSATWEADLFKDFEVVGVISDEYFALNDLLEDDAHIWITGASYYAEEEPLVPKYQPVIRLHTLESGWLTHVATYPEGVGRMQEAALEEGMFFAAYPAVTFSSGGYGFAPEGKLNWNSVVHFVQCRDFASAEEVTLFLHGGYKQLGWTEDYVQVSHRFSCSLFHDFLALYRVGNYVMLLLYAFGGVIFFATLLNLYNSVQYSVQVRRRYLGMMRAVGAKSFVLPRLYLAEILLIFARSLPFAAVFGGGLSFAIKFVIDRAFSDAVSVLSVAIRLHFGFFFAAFAIVLAVLLAAALLISQVAVRKVSHSPIIDVMAAES